MQDDRTEMTINVTLVMAGLLSRMESPSFYTKQADRFELTNATLPHPTDPAFTQGTSLWTEVAADALLLHAWQDAGGHTSTILADMALTHYVSLTSR